MPDEIETDNGEATIASSVLFNDNNNVAPQQDLKVQINDEIIKKGQEVIIKLVGIIGIAIVGIVIGAIWEMNGKISEVIGQNQNPVEIIKYQGQQLDAIQKENIELKAKIEEMNIKKYENEIKRLNEIINNLNTNKGIKK